MNPGQTWAHCRSRGCGPAIAPLIAGLLLGVAAAGYTAEPSRDEALRAMRQATSFMVESVSHRGGYVWNYLPDMSRRWGELEARPTMIWLQSPGTASMGHIFLDAYHATGDEFYYRAAEGVAAAVIAAQHPSGGWNYVADFAGEESLREWYATIGRNAWRLEEFQHYYGNATFDDRATADPAMFLLRMHAEKRDEKFRPALDRAVAFVRAAQYPNGGWPQRFPPTDTFSHSGNPDYTGYITFNDDVAAANIDFLLAASQLLADPSLLDPIARGMRAFRITQQPAPQPGWALQYTPELKPAAARTYEPLALATHTTGSNIEALLDFYERTGDPVFLDRVSEALDWLDGCRLPDEQVTAGRTHPTFIEIGTGRPLFLHRKGSNVFNGHYHTDYEPGNTIGHYSSFRRIDVAELRERFARLKAADPAELARASPLREGAPARALPRFFAVGGPGMDGTGRGGFGGSGGAVRAADRVARVISDLDAEGRWLSPLRITSHPYRGDGSKEPVAGDYAQSQVGDESDTSPFASRDPVPGIATSTYIRNMGTLIRFVADEQ